MCNPIRGCGALSGTSSGYRYGSPDGLGRHTRTESDGMRERIHHRLAEIAVSTRIGLMDSTVPIEALLD